MPAPKVFITRPLIIDKDFRTTVAPFVTSKTREALLPEMVTLLASAEASMVRLLLISNWPLVSVMVWPERLVTKLMMVPGPALEMAARSEPAPLSRLLETVRVAAAAVPTVPAARHNRVRVAKERGVIILLIPVGRDRTELEPLSPKVAGSRPGT